MVIIKSHQAVMELLVNFSTPQIISAHGGNPMKDQSKTKQFLIQELASLKQKIVDLERTASDRKQVES
jgi:hypothetical protein